MKTSPSFLRILRAGLTSDHFGQKLFHKFLVLIFNQTPLNHGRHFGVRHEDLSTAVDKPSLSSLVVVVFSNLIRQLKDAGNIGSFAIFVTDLTLPIDKSSPSTQSGYSPSTKARFSWNIVRVFCMLHNNRNAMHFRPPFLEIDKFFQKVRQVTRPEEISPVRGGKRHWLSETKNFFSEQLGEAKKH